MMANRVVSESVNESMNRFHRVLQSAGRLDRKPHPNEHENQSQDEQDEHFHCERVADRGIRMLRLNAKCMQQRQYRACEEMIQKFSKCQLFHEKRRALSN